MRQLGLAAADARLGWLFAAGAVGRLTAALSLPWLVRRISQPRISLLGFVSTVVVMIGLALANNLTLALGLLLLLCQYMNVLVVVNGITLRQRLTPDRLQGRVNVTARMIAWGGQPFGAALGDFVADRLNISMTYLLLTIGVAVSAVLAWFSSLRKADLVRIDRLARKVE